MFKFIKKRNTQRIFLDYASSTPVDKEVLNSMMPYFSEEFFNSSALYQEGVEIKKVVEDSREKVARILLVKKSDIYFTGSGTEANNIFISGVVNFAKKRGINKPHVIVSSIEHPAIIEVVKNLENFGIEVTYLKVNEEGIVSEKDLENSIKENTVLVSIIYANNEIGVVQPIRNFSRVIKKYKLDNGLGVKDYPFFHTDASQAPNYLDCSVNKLAVDAMTLDGHKIYGPKGIGCLYVNHTVPIEPIMFGGGQEKGLRPGTLNVPAIVGFAKALDKAVMMREKESARLLELQKYFIREIKTAFPKVIINGSEKKRLPNNVNICIPGIDAEFEVLRLDANGVACAYTTACKTSDDLSESYVIKETSGEECARSSLRFSFGRGTKKADLEKTISILKKLIR